MDENLTAPHPEPPPTPKSRAWPWIAAGVVLVVCLLMLSVAIPVGGILIVNTQLAYGDTTATSRANAAQTVEAVSAQPPPGWTKVIGDTFDSNFYRWDLEPNDTYAVGIHPSIEDGHYVYAVDRMPEDDVYIERPAVIRRAQPVQLFLAVEARQHGGSTGDNAYGLVFRDQGWDDYSIFEIQDNGYVAVETYSDGQWSNNIPWTREPSLRLGEFSRLVVVTDQSGYLFLVNNHLVGRVNNLPVERGDVGIFVYGRAPKGVTYEFDNFQLYVPPQP